MRTIALGIAAFLVVAAGLYLIWPEFVSAPAHEEVKSSAEVPDKYDALVTYTEKGYSPSTVTIKKGQAVRWVNAAIEKDSETWPASAVHPTHSLYPEATPDDCLGSAFDACRGIAPGGMWQFTFNEVGMWRFHDHLHPSKTGVVIVE